MEIERKRYHIILAILLGIGVLVLATGCSDDQSLTSPNMTSKYESLVKPAAEFQYPPIEELSVPAGFQVLGMTARERLDDNCDSASQQQFCREDQIRTINVNGVVSVYIPRNAMPTNATIQVILPSRCSQIIDCYPHPFQFEAPVQIIWNISQLQLPQGFDFDSLVPWYVNDAGELIPVTYRWVGDHEQLIVETDHFSRYIVGQRISG